MTVQNTLKLNDRMSPVLSTIVKALSSTLTAMAGVDRVSNSAFKKAERDVMNATAAVRNLNVNLETTDQKAQRAGRSAMSLKNPLVTLASSVYIVKSLAEGFGELSSKVDSFILSKARLKLMNDGLQTTDELQNMIFQSAKNSRGAYEDTAAVIGKMGILAGDAFSSSQEIVAFTELMNKSFKVGGAGIQEQTSAMYQLTQALAAGKLQGDEFRSIMENAPLLAEAIAKYTGKSKGELKEMSSEGTITADIIKGAMFSAADEINASFASMPVTFGDRMNAIKNKALQAFGPVMEKINSAMNNPAIEAAFNNIMSSITKVAQWASGAVDYIVNAIAWLGENIETVKNVIIAAITAVIAYHVLHAAAMTLATIAAGTLNAQLLLMNLWLVLIAALVAVAVYAWNEWGTAGKILAVILGVLAAVLVVLTISQYAFNTALYACPVVWIIAIIVALIAIIVIIIVTIVKLWKTNMDFKYGIIGIWNSILGFFDQVPIFFKKVGNAIATAFEIASIGVATIIDGMVNGVIDSINFLIQALNKIPGVAMDPLEHISLTAAAATKAAADSAERNKELDEMVDNASAKAAERTAKMKADRAADEEKLAKQAADAEKMKQDSSQNNYMYDPDKFNIAGGKLDSSMYDPDKFNIAGGKLDSVGKIDDDISITDEDIKLLKDIATTKFVNKYTTLRPNVVATFGDVRETVDVDQVVSRLEEVVAEAYDSSLQS